MFETRNEPILSRQAFYARFARSIVITLGIIAVSMLIGSAGYHYIGHLLWIDAVLNAAMILTGMGPVNPMDSTPGKLFATFYALYSGIAFLSMVAVLTAPIIHRLMHKFHVEEDEDSKD